MGMREPVSTEVGRKIQEFCNAERNLVELAKNYGGKSNIKLTLFDTPIPKSCVRLPHEAKCQLFEEIDDKYVIRGVCAKSIGSDLKVKAPLVLLHGYGNASLHFYRNLYGLCDHFQTVYSLDIFGWGLSSRPKFQTIDDTVENAEGLVVESLEAWRKVNDIKTMILAGHSFGGYYSIAYSEKYAKKVEKLILISPVGIPYLEGEHEIANPSLTVRLKFFIMKTLWKQNFTPGTFLRTLPEANSRFLIHRSTNNRLINTPEDERKAFADYTVLNSLLPGCGEFALKRILKPLYYALSPTVNRIPKLKVPSISFIYGQNDWMNPNDASEVESICQNKGSGAPSINIFLVENAGHMMFYENWQSFNAAMILADGGIVPVGLPEPFKFHSSLYKPGVFARKYAVKDKASLICAKEMN